MESEGKFLRDGLRELGEGLIAGTSLYSWQAIRIKGRRPVSALRLVNARLAGHFIKAPFAVWSDAWFLDVRQLRRLERVEKRLGLTPYKSKRWMWCHG